MLLTNLRQALLRLLHAPLFTVIAILTLTLGIGATTATLLQASGDDIIMLDQRPSDLPGEYIPCDLGRQESVEQAVAALVGPIDGLANIAGLPGTHPPERILAVNFLGTRALTLGLAGKLREEASIVLVSSIAAHRCSWTDERLQALLDAPSWSHTLAEALQVPMNGGEAYELSKRLLNFWLPVATATFAPVDFVTEVRIAAGHQRPAPRPTACSPERPE